MNGGFPRPERILELTPEEADELLDRLERAVPVRPGFVEIPTKGFTEALVFGDTHGDWRTTFLTSAPRVLTPLTRLWPILPVTALVSPMACCAVPTLRPHAAQNFASSASSLPHPSHLIDIAISVRGTVMERGGFLASVDIPSRALGHSV